MTGFIILIVHASGGIAAILSGFAALLSRKGSLLHRRAGDVFVVSMLVMAAGGTAAAYARDETTNVLAGVLTFYLVTTAWLTVARRKPEGGLAELAMTLLALTTALGAAMLGRLANRPAGFFVFAGVALFLAAGDIRLFILGRLAAAERLARHLWRMGLALFVATGSFFLGLPSDPVLRKTGMRARLITPEIRATHVQWIPVIVVVAVTAYWLVRVLRTRHRDAARKDSPIPAAAALRGQQ